MKAIEELGCHIFPDNTNPVGLAVMVTFNGAEVTDGGLKVLKEVKGMRMLNLCFCTQCFPVAVGETQCDD